ncbi:hypothetical protein HK405_000110, partial [Cladochytrium tenue]
MAVSVALRVALPTASAYGRATTFAVAASRSRGSLHLARRLLATAQPEPVATFANQASLPRLPVPPLAQTAARYLDSCRPLLTPEDFARTKAVVDAFAAPAGLGTALQQRLLDLDAQTP